jgi:hypothetical protein
MTMKDATLNNSADNLYKERLQGWTKREIQLNRLHEEMQVFDLMTIILHVLTIRPNLVLNYYCIY